MCGIYGMVLNEGNAVQEHWLHTAVRLLHHRGPDASGIYVSPCGRVGLAHTRLAVLGRANGNQPMSTPDGRLRLIYNGEIYNHLDIRRQLEASGAGFRSRCDTETLLQAYARHGVRCLQRLEGMFAFAVWDEAERIFFAARDHTGQKPLYYLQTRAGLFFCSEIWPLLLTPGYEPRIDLEALQQYLNYYLPMPPLTLLEGIERLPPGCHLQVRAGRAQVSRWWHPCYRVKRREPEGALIAECRDLLQEIVQKHLISEVPLGCMLSGGIDSSAVAAMAQAAVGGQLRTFSAFYKDPHGRDIDYDYAQMVAAHLGTEHVNMLYDAADLFAELPAVVRHFGEPYGSFNGAISLAISRLMKEHVTVALSGNGGDEVFAGYNTHRSVARLDRRAVRALLSVIPAAPFRWYYCRASAGMPAFDNRWLRLYTLAQTDRHAQRIAHSELFLRQRLFSPEAVAHMPPVEDALVAVHHAADADTWLDRWTYADLMARMQENMVTRADMTGMAASLEIRAPLLDHRLIEFAAGLPMDLRIKAGRVGKYILREAVRPMLPAAIFDRPKQGFSGVSYAQLIHSARGVWRPPFAELLFEPGAWLSFGLFRPEGIEAVWQVLQDGPANHPRTTRCFQIVWMLVSLRIWEEQVRLLRADQRAVDADGA